MLDLLELQAYLDDIKANIPAIKTTRLVIDDSQINDVVKDLKESENLILLALVPSHQMTGQNEDDVMSRDILAFLVLRKADRKIKHSDFITNLHGCQQAAKDLIIKLIQDKSEYNDGCSFLNQLSISGLNADPVYNLAGTDGYEINCSMQTHL